MTSNEPNARRITQTLRITVDLPQPLQLVPGRDRLQLLVGPGEDWVEIDGTGMVTVHHGGQVLYGVNVLTAAKAIRDQGRADR